MIKASCRLTAAVLKKLFCKLRKIAVTAGCFMWNTSTYFNVSGVITGKHKKCEPSISGYLCKG